MRLFRISCVLILCWLSATMSVSSQVLIPRDQRHTDLLSNVFTIDYEPIHSIASISYTIRPFSYVWTNLRIGLKVNSPPFIEGGSDLMITFKPDFDAWYALLSITELRGRIGPGIGYVYRLDRHFLVNAQVAYSIVNSDIVFGTNDNVDPGSAVTARVSIGVGF